jgi:hypothetical protein
MNAAASSSNWRLAASVECVPDSNDWRDLLARQLGHRPRRLGLWAELALHGALSCLAQAGEATLPAAARLRVSSLSGAQVATRTGIAQVRAGRLPMPFDFMQSQPALMLAALGQALGWRGDGSFVIGREPEALMRTALRGAAPQGLLFGQVEQDGARLRTAWWRWVQAPAAGAAESAPP